MSGTQSKRGEFEVVEEEEVEEKQTINCVSWGTMRQKKRKKLYLAISVHLARKYWEMIFEILFFYISVNIFMTCARVGVIELHFAHSKNTSCEDRINKRDLMLPATGMSWIKVAVDNLRILKSNSKEDFTFFAYIAEDIL